MSTNETLQAISEVITRINDMSRQIATATEERGAVAEEVNKNVVRINDMTSQTADGAIQTSEASKNITQLSAELNRVVQQFQI